MGDGVRGLRAAAGSPSRAMVVTPVVVHADVGDRVPRWLSQQACSAAAVVGLVGTIGLVAMGLCSPARCGGQGLAGARPPSAAGAGRAS